MARIDDLKELASRDTDKCIEWPYALVGKGYGYLWVGSESRMMLAHRAVLWIRDGGHSEMLVLHSCDNPSCVNPRHLRYGSYSDNVADMDARGRRVNNNDAKTHCPQGHPYVGDNLYVSPSTGSRKCQACRRSAEKKYYRKKRAQWT